LRSVTLNGMTLQVAQERPGNTGSR
jgi:hypothetical protein